MKQLITNTILQGDALEQLKTLPDESVNMVITSPPYWGLRDYGAAGQLGLEPDFRDFIKNLCDIFDEVKRVLKPEGTCWVNLGDSYMGGGKGGQSGEMKSKHWIPAYGLKQTKSDTIRPKSLAQIPSRFAIEMTDRGWILRNEIIWHKPNIMPQSVRDRFTVDFEKLFFFTKSKKYYFEQQFDKAVWDIDGTGTIKRALRQQEGNKSNPDQLRNGVRRVYPTGKHGDSHQSAKYVDGLRNKRTVWTITTEPFADSHFAVYPPKLLQTPIAAGCPEGGIVLDPFFGSGTTGLVADKMGRKWIGIELNPEYIEIAKKRLKQEVLF